MADSLSLDGRDSEKTRQATQKSRTQWFSRVAALFRNAELDDLLWEQVEEMLISADVGVDATFDLIEVVRDTVKGQGDLGAACLTSRTPLPGPRYVPLWVSLILCFQKLSDGRAQEGLVL